MIWSVFVGERIRIRSRSSHILKKEQGTIFKCGSFPPLPFELTSSCRNRSLAMCTIRSTWMMPPMLFTSMSERNVRTRIASTKSCLYSGWGTWFSTDSTCTANLISHGVIWQVWVEMETKTDTSKRLVPHILQALTHMLLSVRGGRLTEANKMLAQL